MPLPRPFFIDPPCIDRFTSWLQQRDTTMHPDLGLDQDETGWRIVAQNDISRGKVLCAVPKYTVFSHRTSNFSAIVKLPAEPSPADYTLHVAACLLYELRLGSDSIYEPWLQVLPRHTILLPTFWGDESICGEDGVEASRWIKGTEVEHELRRKNQEGLSLDDIKAYHSSISSDFPPTSTYVQPPCLEEYLYAYSMVSTRGYIIDAYHIIALIPFVDMFNHSNTPHTSLLSDATCCPTCGSLALCSHDDQSLPRGESRISHLSPEYLARVKAEGENVDMRVEREVKAGEEVFSCYEEHLTAGKCIVEWGFNASEACSVELSWTPREVLEPEFGEVYIVLISSGRIAAELEDVLSRNKWVYTTEDPGCFDVISTGSVSLNLVIALYLRTLDEDPDSLEDLEDGCVAAIRMALSGEGRTGASKWLGQEVTRLIDARKEGMYRPDLGVEGLREEIKRLAERSSLTKMIMTLSLKERILCEMIEAHWS